MTIPRSGYAIRGRVGELTFIAARLELAFRVTFRAIFHWLRSALRKGANQCPPKNTQSEQRMKSSLNIG